MRISAVALRPVHGDGGVQAATPADLHHLAQACGLVGSPTRQASSASPRAASAPSILRVPLIDGPSSSPVISSATEPRAEVPARRESGRRRRRSRRPPSSFGRAPAPAGGRRALRRRRDRRSTERGRRAARRRCDRRSIAPGGHGRAGPKVVHRGRALLLEAHPLAGEAQRPQRRLEHAERARVLRRDARAADQGAGEVERIEGRGRGRTSGGRVSRAAIR